MVCLLSNVLKVWKILYPVEFIKYEKKLLKLSLEGRVVNFQFNALAIDESTDTQTQLNRQFLNNITEEMAS